MSKLTRQNLILELAEQETLANQEELRKRLVKHGFDVTQATLSRDIHELGLVKTANGYARPANEPATEPMLPSAMRLVREFVLEVREAQNLLVIKTATGSAQPVAAAIDAEQWMEMVGTVAGDDTILVISQNKRNAHKIALRIRGMLV
jgi:transcriptional regulator of arginine metabolism